MQCIQEIKQNRRKVDHFLDFFKVNFPKYFTPNEFCAMLSNYINPSSCQRILVYLQHCVEGLLDDHNKYYITENTMSEFKMLMGRNRDNATYCSTKDEYDAQDLNKTSI